MKLKTYCNREDINDLMQTVTLSGQVHFVGERFHNRIVTEEEYQKLLSAEELLQEVLQAIFLRMEQNQKGFVNRLKRDADKAEVFMSVPATHFMENQGKKIRLSRELLQKLVDGNAAQCMGCEQNPDDCYLCRLMDMLEMPPINANSEQCPYRITKEELDSALSLDLDLNLDDAALEEQP